MPAATNILKATTTSDAAPAGQATPGGDVFAALMSGTEAVTETAAAGDEATVAEISGEPQPNLDILAPLLAQQQVVPTVTVPTVAAETVAIEGDAATAMAGTVATSPLVPSEVEGRLTEHSNPNPTAASVIAATLGQAPADAPRLRSDRAVGEGLPKAAETTADQKGIEAIQASVTETGKTADKPAALNVAAPTISAPAKAGTGDQQASGGQPQQDASQTIEIQAQQQPTANSVTDVRSLIASLTGATGLAGTGGPGQAGAAQQLGAALAAQVLDLAGGSEWLEQLSDEIGRATDGSGPLRFRLTPESLGELKVEISQSDRGAVVRMTVATEAAQAALADAQPRLAGEARAQGVRIAETQVDLAGNQTQQHQQGRESARQQGASADQSLRAFRSTSGASSATQSGTATSRPAERYA